MKSEELSARTRVLIRDGRKSLDDFIKRAVLSLFPGGQASGSKAINEYRAPLPFPEARVERHAGRVLPFPAPRG